MASVRKPILDSAGRNGSFAGVAELVDALVLGTSGESRGGSSPSARTIGACRYFDGVMAWRVKRVAANEKQPGGDFCLRRA